MKITDPRIKGKFLLRPAIKTWTEDFVDEDTGEIVSIERNEIIASKGTHLDIITLSLLQENDIQEIEVSDVQRLGNWTKMQTKYEVTAIVPRKQESGKTKRCTEMYIVYSDSAAESESIIVDELEQNCQGNFKISKVAISKIDDIINENGDKYFKAVVNYLTDDGEGKMNILVHANNLDNASEIIRNHPSMPNDITISELKDTKFVDVHESKKHP